MATRAEKKAKAGKAEKTAGLTPLTGFKTLEEKYQAALQQIGGRLKLTAIMTRRLKELRMAGLKQRGSFNEILDSLLDEILDGSLILEEPKKSSK